MVYQSSYQIVDVFNIIAIVTDGLSFLLLGILALGAIFESKEKNNKTKYFLLVCLFLSLTVLVDAIGYALPYAIEHDKNRLVLKILCLAAVIISDFITVPFGFYEAALIKQKNPKANPKLPLMNMIVTGSMATLEIVLAFVGDGNMIIMLDESCNFLYGNFYWVVYVGFGFSFLFMLFTAILYIKTLGRHDTIVIFIYLLLPIVGIVIELLIDGLSISYAFVTIAAALVYIMLQSGHINDLSSREEILREASYKDSLTGVSNRRAYNDLLDSLDMIDIFGLIYCDLNKLKYTNDHYGHEAGDELLNNFVEIAKKYFDIENIYRISGDEFILADTTSDPTNFLYKVNNFRRELVEAGEIASSGFAYGSGKMALNLIKEAETMMYKNKDQFHARNPEFTR